MFSSLDKINLLTTIEPFHNTSLVTDVIERRLVLDNGTIQVVLTKKNDRYDGTIEIRETTERDPIRQSSVSAYAVRENPVHIIGTCEIVWILDEFSALIISNRTSVFRIDCKGVATCITGPNILTSGILQAYAIFRPSYWDS